MTVLHDATLDIQAGERNTIMGCNALGKSSLIRLMTRFYGVVMMGRRGTKLLVQAKMIEVSRARCRLCDAQKWSSLYRIVTVASCHAGN